MSTIILMLLRGSVDEMRVLLLTSHPINGRDGADKEISTLLAEGLPGIAFTYFGRSGYPRPVPGRRVPIWSRTGSPGPLERAQIVARAPQLAKASDLVHIVMTIGPGYAAWSRSRLLPRRRPVVLTAPGVVSDECLSYSNAVSVCVALSSVTAERFRDVGYPDVRVIPPGIDLGRWRFHPRRRNVHPVLFFAGHTDGSGGTREAIEIASRVEQAGQAVRLVLALRTRPWQDELRELRAAEMMARQAGVTNVTVVGRVESMVDVVAAADVVLFTPERLDGGKADVPLTLLEAMATGRPVVASSLPGMAALKESIVQVPPKPLEAAADAVRALLTDEGRWEKQARIGRLSAEQSFSSDKMCRSYTEIYDELLRREGAEEHRPSKAW